MTVAPRPAALRPSASRRRSKHPSDRIVAAASDLFATYGYHGTSIREIADLAAVKPPAIYVHFGSKQGVLAHLMHGAITEVLMLTRTVVAAAPDTPVERVAAFVRAWIGFHTQRQQRAMIHATELRSLEESRDVVIELRDQQERLFAGLVEDGLRTGDFTTPHPREAVRAALQMGRDVCGWYVAGGPLCPEQVAEQYVELTLALLRA